MYMCPCVGMCTCEYRYMQSVGEGLQLPRVGAADNCELPSVGSGTLTWFFLKSSNFF